MSDSFKIKSSVQSPSRQPRNYQSHTAREVHTRASTFRKDLSEQDQRSIQRLTRFLTQGIALETNVPRGFYLNILV